MAKRSRNPLFNFFRGRRVTIDKEVGKDIVTLSSQEFIDLLNRIQKIVEEKDELYALYDLMAQDSLIQSAIELIAEDATQLDDKENAIVWIKSDDDKLRDKLNKWLWDIIKIDELIWPIAFDLIKYGNVYIRTFAGDEEFIRSRKRLGDYFEIHPYPAKIAHLAKFGDTTGYYVKEGDRDQYEHFYHPDAFIHVLSDRSNRNTEVEITRGHGHDHTTEKMTVIQGVSFIDAARTIWQILSLLEKILLLSRFSKSVNYRIFNVEVGTATVAEANSIIQNLKKSIKSSESIDLQSKTYRSNNSPVPINSNIYQSVREGKGAITINDVSSDTNLKDIVDIDYFTDKLFAALKVPKAFLTITEDLPGSIGSTTLTRQDIRYARTVKRVQVCLRAGIYQMCCFKLAVDEGLYDEDIYRRTLNESTGRGLRVITEEVLDRVAKKYNFEIMMTKVTSAQDADTRENIEGRVALAEAINNLAAGSAEVIDLRRLFKFISTNILEMEGLDKVLLPEGEEAEGEVTPVSGGGSAPSSDFGQAVQDLAANAEEPPEEEIEVEEG